MARARPATEGREVMPAVEDPELRGKFVREIRRFRSEVDAGHTTYEGWLRWRKARALLGALEHLYHCYFGEPPPTG